MFNITKLKKSLNCENIKRIKGKHTHFCYLIDNKKFLKVSKTINSNGFINNEIQTLNSLKNLNLFPIPINSGQINGHSFIITNKIDGIPLNKIWKESNENTKLNYIRQIANILKTLHTKTSITKINKDYWANTIKQNLKLHIQYLNFHGIETEKINQLLINEIDTIFSDQKISILHFDNVLNNFILTPNNNIVIIDFDKSVIGSIDYELATLNYKIKNKNVEKFYDLLVTEYKELTNVKYLKKRRIVYNLIFNLTNIAEKTHYNRNKAKKIVKYFCKNYEKY